MRVVVYIGIVMDIHGSFTTADRKVARTVARKAAVQPCLLLREEHIGSTSWWLEIVDTSGAA